MKKFALVLMVLILSLGFFGCSNGTNGNGGGSDKWSLLVGDWEWIEGGYNIDLQFEDKEMGIINHPRYHFFIDFDLPGISGGSNVFWCSFDGTTLKIMDYDDTLEKSFTVTLSNNNQTLSFSNYKNLDGDSDYEYLIGKTFTKK